MAETWTPTEAQIARAIDAAGGDIRKMAIAYLRASRRAREADLAFDLVCDIQELTLAAATSDVDRAERAAASAKRHVAHARDVNESEG